MRVLAIDPDPVDELPCLNAAGRGRVERVRLPLLRGRASGLPADLDALVLAADLQMLELPGSRPPRLVGEALAEHLAATLEAPERTGVLLAGDLFTVFDLAKRGGSGDVRSVWRAFAERFRWVAGVLGNHDEIGDRNGELARFARTPGVHLFDGDRRTLDGLRVGGVSGILGSRTKLNRHEPQVYRDKLEDVLLGGVDVLVLHEGPDDSEGRFRGSADIREWIEESGASPLVVCGHSWWPETLVTLRSGLQIVKVDARVVVLERN